MLYIYLLFIIYTSLAGVVEGILYAKKGAESFVWNEHILYLLKAGVVLFGFLITPFLVDMTFNENIICTIACVCAYPFFHDGFYYETARRINRPDYKFSSNSKTSTAKIEISWFLRMNLLIVSLIFIIANFLW